MNTATIIRNLNCKLTNKVAVKYNGLYVNGQIAIKFDRTVLVNMLNRLDANAEKLRICPSCSKECELSLDCGASFHSLCSCGAEGTMAALPVDTNITWRKTVGHGYTINVSRLGDKVSTELRKGKDSVRRYNGCEFELAAKQAELDLAMQ